MLNFVKLSLYRINPLGVANPKGVNRNTAAKVNVFLAIGRVKGGTFAVVDVNRVLKQYDAMLLMMKQMNGAGKRQMKKMNKKMKKQQSRKGGKQQPQMQAPAGLFGGLGNLFK